MFGFLNVYKPKGMTSHDVVAVLRRITKIKQIGHTGTLDPFAEGVLPICIGKATRLIEYLNDDKAYVAQVQLGSATSTYDLEGEIVNENKDFELSIEEISVCLNDFRGEIEQLPPMYSAIKLGGKKLYEYARKGETVEVPKRRVTISKLDVLDYDKQLKRLKLYVACSKGTYIRSIANDLGEKLGVYAHLIELTRVKAGGFEIDNAIKLEDIKSVDDVEASILSPLEYLDYPKIELSEKEKTLVSNGMPINRDIQDGLVILTAQGKIASVAEAACGVIKSKKVLL